MTGSGGPRVVVVGAGFGGLGVARDLRRAGIRNVTILERADDIGGVWRDNTYPGAACDVPSALYSWSWAPKHDWSHKFARQPEILGYLRSAAERTGLRDLVRTGCEVDTARWDDRTRQWRIALTTGESLNADVLICAVGQLSRPAVPTIPGLESFAGPQFHSAAWDHAVALRGRRVGVVGTGASAIQFVPGIVDDVGALTVFQRSAPYVIPKADRAYASWQKRTLTHVPWAHAVARRRTFWLSERLNRTLDDDGRFARILHQWWRLHLRRQVTDPALRAKLVPDYPFGCKRILLSNDWYPALSRDHVEVITDRIERVAPAGIHTADGAFHELDVLVLGTGFAATEFLAPMRIIGRHGVALDQAWIDGAYAHLGMTVPGFPSFFCVYGPNTNLGGSSIIGMLEAQASYITQAVRVIADGGVPLEVLPAVADAFDQEMQERLQHSVWTGCSSWYRSQSGRVSANWPGLVAEYQRRTEVFTPGEYAAPYG